jgi:hypothetical protein
MDDRLRSVRERVRQLQRGRSKRSVRYPAEVRAVAGAYAREQRARGVSLNRIARDLGVQWNTLRLWLLDSRPRRLRPVVVQDAAVTVLPTCTLVTPQGFRVEGLDASSLATLLRALA